MLCCRGLKHIQTLLPFTRNLLCVQHKRWWLKCQIGLALMASINLLFSGCRSGRFPGCKEYTGSSPNEDESFKTSHHLVIGRIINCSTFMGWCVRCMDSEASLVTISKRDARCILCERELYEAYIHCHGNDDWSQGFLQKASQGQVCDKRGFDGCQAVDGLFMESQTQRHNTDKDRCCDVNRQPPAFRRLHQKITKKATPRLCDSSEKSRERSDKAYSEHVLQALRPALIRGFTFLTAITTRGGSLWFSSIEYPMRRHCIRPHRFAHLLYCREVTMAVETSIDKAITDGTEEEKLSATSWNISIQ